MTVALTIKDVSARTGIAAGTIRMWEQRYGFPAPNRTSAGYRIYGEDDVTMLQRVAALRQQGLSVPAAIERAVESDGVAKQRSIYAAVANSDLGAHPQVLRKSTLVTLSRAIEHEAMAHAHAPILFAAFQREQFYRRVGARYRRMARLSQAAVVFADFAELASPDDGPVEIPISPDDQLANEWTLIVDTPGFCACLLAWELPGGPEPGSEDDASRRFESLWTIDPRATRRAALVAANLAGVASPELRDDLLAQLEERPLAVEQPAPTLTALTNRMVAYLEE